MPSLRWVPFAPVCSGKLIHPAPWIVHKQETSHFTWSFNTVYFEYSPTFRKNKSHGQGLRYSARHVLLLISCSTMWITTCWVLLQSWWWWLYHPQKLRPLSEIHCVTNQKTKLFLAKTVGTSLPTLCSSWLQTIATKRVQDAIAVPSSRIKQSRKCLNRHEQEFPSWRRKRNYQYSLTLSFGFFISFFVFALFSNTPQNMLGNVEGHSPLETIPSPKLSYLDNVFLTVRSSSRELITGTCK